MGFNNDSFNDGSIDFSDSSDECTMFEKEWKRMFAKEKKAISIPIDVKQKTLLSDIWIPSRLLPNKRKFSNNRVTKGLFHTLEKRDSSQVNERFSVYSDTESENFSSDSEDKDLLKFDIGSCKNFEKCAKTLSENALAVTTVISSGDICSKYNEKDSGLGVCSNLIQIPSVDNLCDIGVDKTLNHEKARIDSHISLNEILDISPEFHLNDFRHDDIAVWGQEKLEQKGKKIKRKKKKATKIITLDEFRADFTEDDNQTACCNEYFRKLLIQKNKTDGVQLKSQYDFPDLAPKELEFIHSENFETKNESPNISMLTEVLGKSNEVNTSKNKSRDCIEETACAVSETEITWGKLVIENIPKEANEEDIYSFLSGLGDIQHFSLKPVGKFQKAHVTIDLISDIDWIIDCLHGEYAFGTSNKPLKCYKEE